MNQDSKDRIDPTSNTNGNPTEEKKWYKRDKDGIFTPTKDKKETPDGLWVQCPSCKASITQKELSDNLEVCPHCEHHFRMGSDKYFRLLFDDGEFKEHDSEMRAADPLTFVDKKPYRDRLEAAQKKTALKDAVKTASGKVHGNELMVACMDFTFIGGSMGSVVGEKIGRAIDYSLKHKCPLLIISKSGGARMMEAAFSLMQMAKTSAKLALLSKARIPFISLMTVPTTGGVTASYAMLGDINLGEPGALIGFAGPRVIKETIKQDLPDGFQTSEFLLEHGLLDMIVKRDELRETISSLMGYMTPKARRKRAAKA